MKKIIFFAFAVLYSTNAALAQVPSYVPTSGLVGWWPFNGNANDESGNGNNGTVNGPTLTTDRFGNASKAYSFAGGTDRITITKSILPSSKTSYSISMWVLSLTGAGEIICDRSTSTWDYKYRLFINKNLPNSQIRFSTAIANTSSVSNVDGGAFNQPIWQHVAVVGNATDGTTALFINGVLIGKSDLFYPNLLNATTIGANYAPSTFDAAINGKLDDIGIWSRALDSNEIKKLYTGCMRDEITTEPSNASKPTTSTAKFDVTAKSGSAYQWQSNPIGFGWQNVPNTNQYSGATTQSLSISNLALNNHKQQFRAIVTNTGCKDTSKVVELIITDTCINTKSVSVADTLKFAVNLTGVAPPNNRNTMKVYPNPTNSAVVIDNGNYTTMANYIVKIENSIGQQVFFSKVNQQQFVVDVSTLGGKGIYTLSVLDPTGKLLETKKIVLQ
jgi:hypothetical protein